ncbi:MAG: hypothetical protein EBQ80_04850 [Proteobacteria bacterium]|nr:hypothetical protein [Pseudomonadota bacterium]
MLDTMPVYAWFIVIGLALLVLDTVFLGVSAVLFFGISMVLVGLLVTQLALSWPVALVLAALLGVALAYFGQPMLTNWQEKSRQTISDSDFVGKTFTAASDISATAGTIVWNGVDMPTRLHTSATGQSIPTGTAVQVVDVRDSVLYVR